MELRILVDLSEFAPLAEGAEKRLMDLSPLHASFEDPLANHLRDHMEHQVGPEFVPFAPLSRGYGSWKEAHYPGLPILQLTHEMIQSITRGHDEDSAWAFFEDDKATAHQLGVPSRNLPARPPAWISESFADGSGRRTAEWILAGTLGEVVL